MGPRSKLMCLAIFSWYFNCLNSDFNPWAIILNGIQYSLQWCWFYPNKMATSKVNSWLPWKSTLCQNWSKLTKSSNNLRFDINTWKEVILMELDQFWPLVNSWLIRGILVILSCDTLSILMLERVKPWWSQCSHGPLVKKWFFFGIFRI